MAGGILIRDATFAPDEIQAALPEDGAQALADLGIDVR